jgi:serine/threonine protein kinase
MLPQIRREIRIMYNLNHPYTIKLYNHFEDDTNFYLVMELAPNGNLYNRLHRYKSFDERTTA